MGEWFKVYGVMIEEERKVIMYYIWREDNMVLADIGSGKQQTFVPYGTRNAAFFSLQAAIMKVAFNKSKERAFVVAAGELPPFGK